MCEWHRSLVPGGNSKLFPTWSSLPHGNCAEGAGYGDGFGSKIANESNRDRQERSRPSQGHLGNAFPPPNPKPPWPSLRTLLLATETPLAGNCAGKMSGASMQPHEGPVCGVTSLSSFLTFRKPLPACFLLTSVGEPTIHYMLQHEVRHVNICDTSNKTNRTADHHNPFSPWP